MEIQLIEVDPNKKYVIQTQDFLRSEIVDNVTKDFERFLKDPDRHIFILSRGLLVRKNPQN